MKVIIVGGGISGLSTYLLLQKHVVPVLADTNSPLSVIIYESHEPRTTGTSTSPDAINLDDLSSSTALVGGGLGVGPNGMRVLRHISEQLYQRVRTDGFVVEKNVFKSAYGWRLMVQDFKAPARDGLPEERLVSCSRDGLWRALRDEVIGGSGGSEAIEYRKVVEVVAADGEGRKATVRFEDGEEELADLVIGCDGVRSAVRKGIAKSRGEDGDARWAPKYM